MTSQPYIGRFAPSPSGPLHFGSLVCAVASFLHAKQHQGQWLVRIEDIDPPREQAGAADEIRRCLEAHQLFWDGDVLYQSERSEAYQSVLESLTQDKLCYPCNCTRKRLQSLVGFYDGHCLKHLPKPNEPCSLRLKTHDLPPLLSHIKSDILFNDETQGTIKENLASTSGDFVIHRKDGLFAYQLAVVVDDIAQNISHVVRGDDLLDTTARQIYLFELLGHTAPQYNHIPVVLDSNGNKLSKQNHAPSLDYKQAKTNLKNACEYLGQSEAFERYFD